MPSLGVVCNYAALITANLSQSRSVETGNIKLNYNTKPPTRCDLQLRRTIKTLSEKYNENKVNSAIAQICSLTPTDSVKNLTDLLKKYELCNNGLRTTINDILVIDMQLDANDEYMQEKNYKWFYLNLHGVFGITALIFMTILICQKQYWK